MTSQQPVVFVCHAMPVVRTGAAPVEWELDDRAREDCVLLAHALRYLNRPFIRSSPEPRARQTADVLGLRLGSWPVDDDDLRDVRRPATTFGDCPAPVRAYLSGDRPAGWEHPMNVTRRVAAAVERACRCAGDASPVVVTHGIALALYVASLGIADPVPFWESLRFPSALSVDVTRGTLSRVFPVIGPR